MLCMHAALKLSFTAGHGTTRLNVLATHNEDRIDLNLQQLQDLPPPYALYAPYVGVENTKHMYII